VRLFVDRWEHPVHGDEMIAMLRAGVTSDIVAEQFQSVLSQLVTEPIAALGDQRATERGTLIAAQLLGLGLCRYILRFEPLASMTADDVVASVGPSVQRYLTQPVGGRPGRGPAD
jgi:hypothetical protein